MPSLNKPLSHSHKACSFSGLLTTDAVVPSPQTVRFLQSETYLAPQSPSQESVHHTAGPDRHRGPPSWATQARVSRGCC